MQKYTSRHTSVNSNKLPAIYTRFKVGRSSIVFDYGCGKFIDHIKQSLPAGVTYLPYDPFNQPQEVNCRSIERLAKACYEREPVDIVCSNVLNVIDDDRAVNDIALFFNTIHSLVGGSVFVAVYEGNKTGIGKPTGNDQYQRNLPIEWYKGLFPRSSIENRTIILQ